MAEIPEEQVEMAETETENSSEPELAEVQI